MKLILTTAGDRYDAKEAKKMELLGFEMKKNTSSMPCYKGSFLVKRCPTITIDTMDDLKSLSNKAGKPLIFDGGTIKIYDDFIE